MTPIKSRYDSQADKLIISLDDSPLEAIEDAAHEPYASGITVVTGDDGRYRGMVFFEASQCLSNCQAVRDEKWAAAIGYTVEMVVEPSPEDTNQYRCYCIEGGKNTIRHDETFPRTAEGLSKATAFISEQAKKLWNAALPNLKRYDIG